MSGYAQVTIRRNRDGSVVIITESTDKDPQYEHFGHYESYAAHRAAQVALDGVVG
jgi:hypothetical protein